MKNILVIGSGAMGAAFTFPCIDNGNNVSLVGTPLENNIIDKLNRNNKFHKVLGRSLPKKLKIFKVDKLNEKLKAKPDLIVVGVNSKGIEWAAKEISKIHNGKIPILASVIFPISILPGLNFLTTSAYFPSGTKHIS